MKTGERIVFIPETSAFGGGERVLLALSRFLHERTIPHRFAWYYRAVDLAKHAAWPVQEEHLEPKRKPMRKIRALDSYLHRAQAANSGTVLLVGIQAALHAAFCREENYSLLILDTPSLLSMPAGAMARCKARLRHQLTRPLIGWAMHRARSVMATTDYMAREICDLYQCPATVVRQGAPQGSFTHQRFRSGQKLRLLSVCRLEASKRVDWILSALASLHEGDQGSACNLDWELDVVGAGSQGDVLQARAWELGIGRQVHFHGRTSDERLEKLYAEAHLFLMPARQGYGLPALEALSRGLPVVVHKDSGVSEILGNNPWVELIDGNAPEIARAIQKLTRRLISGELADSPLPPIPSENEWAEAVARQCGWL